MAFQVEPLASARSEEARAVWNAALGFFFPMSPDLFRQNVLEDPNYRSGDGLLALVDGQVVGFGLAKRVRGREADLPGFAGVGHVAALAVAPPFQRRGIGSGLLAMLEDRLRSEGVREIRAGGGFLHFLPGPPVEMRRQLAFWGNRGYILGPEVYDLRRALADYQSPPKAEKAWQSWRRPLSVGPVLPRDRRRLLQFVLEEFGAPWWYFARYFLRRRAGPETILVLREGEDVVGFCHVYPPGSAFRGPSIYWQELLEQPCGGLGPIGIARHMRGHGLGLAFLDRCLRFLQSAGVRDCVIDWTELVDFYAVVGFSPWKAYLPGRKRQE